MRSAPLLPADAKSIAYKTGRAKNLFCSPFQADHLPGLLARNILLSFYQNL
jgi:hypothetical protein